MAKRIVDVAFALGVSLHYTDYLTEEDLKSYGLASIDEDDISPLGASLGSTIMRLLAAEVASNVSPAEIVLPTVALSSSTVVPPWATTQVTAVASSATLVSPLVDGFTLTPRDNLCQLTPHPLSLRTPFLFSSNPSIISLFS